MPNILGIGESALNAAQIGLATTGHNIANASTPGYTRQVVVQGTAGGQNLGGGFVGKGTEVVAVQRVYNEFLQAQMASSQTSLGQVSTYYRQMTLIDNMLSDPTVGVSPALQDFFTSMQALASDPGSAAARQTMLSNPESLAARFQSMDSQLTEIRQGVNSQIRTSMEKVNTLARQISELNDQVERAMRNSSNGQEPNDLLDQRDHAITELSKLVKVSSVKQSSSYDVYIGNGQPLVIGTKTFQLVQVQSPTDSGRMEIGYVNQQGITMMDEGAFGGGQLGGLFDFRSRSLDPVQNALGRIAIVMGSAFNEQHRLGQDVNGNMGGEFFRVAEPLATASTANLGTGKLSASFTDVSKLTTSDYKIKITQEAAPPDQALAFTVTRLSDGKSLSGDQFDGLRLSFSGEMKAGDEFLLRPTVNGANNSYGLAVNIKDKNLVAAGSPIRGSAATANTGSGSISPGSVNAGLPLHPDLKSDVQIVFSSPTTYTVTGSSASLPQPPDNSFSYTPGADISFNGWTVQITGSPAAGDSFSVGANAAGLGDGRKAFLLGKLQTASLVEGMSNLQGAYAEMVNVVGNKTQELKVTSDAADKLAEIATKARDAESAVNLDEEAANLLRYQQAYQAASKVMKTAQELFQLLLSLG